MGERRHTALAALLATWFGLTVVGQKLWRRERLGRSGWEPLHLVLPDWRFFAPDPGVHDQHVLYRSRTSTGTTTEWTEIGGPAARRARHMIWNPAQRVDKALWDVCAELTRFIEVRDRTGIDAATIARDVQLSVPYLTLLHLASCRGREGGSATVQFMIVQAGGWDPEPPEVVFLSEWHPIADRRRAVGGAEQNVPEPSGRIFTQDSH